MDVWFEAFATTEKELEAALTVDSLASEVFGLGCDIRIVKISIAYTLTATSVFWPSFALSDHVPDNLAQELNPNYIGCMMAVEDATSEFRDALQLTCIKQMGDICDGGSGDTLPSQVVDCIYFEAQRAVAFLAAAAPDLPEKIEMKGFFGHNFQRRRENLFTQVADFNEQKKPDNIEGAIQQFISIALQVTNLFWLARETVTPLGAHVRAVSETH